MPVSEEGPVSLYPPPSGKGQLETPSTDGEGSANKRAGEEALQAAEQADGGGEPAAVAALAQRLARSAMGVLEASELENAKQVDFEHLDAESKAEVAEKFADAIESVAQAVQEETNPLEMADGQAPEPAPQGQPAAKGLPAVASASAMEMHRYAETEAHLRAEAAAAARARQEPKEAPREPRHVPEPVSTEPAWLESLAKVAPPKPSAAPAPLVVQPLAQAQFMGAAQAPVPFQGGGALESVVREMLRPLLVQWLNENMPRILENAIREEIATRGLLPKSDG